MVSGRLTLGILSAVLVFGWWIANRGPYLNANRGPAVADTQTEADALVDCQMAIKAASRDRSKVSAPFRASSGTGAGDYYFAWPAGAGLQMPNGVGVVVDASASCYHNGKQITGLTINGEKVL